MKREDLLCIMAALVFSGTVENYDDAAKIAVCLEGEVMGQLREEEEEQKRDEEIAKEARREKREAKKREAALHTAAHPFESGGIGHDRR